MSKLFGTISTAESAGETTAAVAGAVSQQQRAALFEKASQAAARGSACLFGRQYPEGYWYGDLTADSTLECDYLLLELWLYPPDAEGRWNPPAPVRARLEKAIRAIWERQLPSGGWRIYNPGPVEINATVRAYTILKLWGVSIDDPRMKQARELILSLGGLQACNSYTKINFSLFGLFPREFAPTVPPEIVSMPGSLLYQMSSWTRTIIVPLSIVQALGGVKPTPHGLNVNELIHPKKKLALPRKDYVSAVFNQADKLVKRWAKSGPQAIRQAAIRSAERWMLERLHNSEGLGAIYPSMMYAIMAMDAMGYERDHPDLERAIADFDALMLESDSQLIFQPAKSPVWDTAIAMFALGELGQAEPERMTRGADWLLTKQIRRRGDWSAKRPDLVPGAWAFEFDNEFYPDIDDTAMVLMALQHAQASDPEKQRRAEERAVNWLLGMQSSDGGWAAFDVDNNWQLLNKIPFADHNAMLDPPCPDITGRVMDCLCRRGFDHTHPAIAAGIEYLLRHQEENGSWFGRWGVNYVYGTFLAMRGLAATGADSPEVLTAIARGAEWLRRVQNRDGGWGESCRGYETNRFEPAPSTPTQTAWALLGLLVEGDLASRAIYDGAQWLVDRQSPEGTWSEEITTGTGFPGVFYISYHLYPEYFPLLALARLEALSQLPPAGEAPLP
jgi:squalene-hopene/tetraprenyl-beta-curcumene cyclase